MKMDMLSEGTRAVGLEDAPNQRVAVSGNLIAAMTTQQYQDGLYAAFRELVTNAAESHVLAQQETVPFGVSLDFPLVGETIQKEDGETETDVRQATFTIRDYGIGMSPEFIEDGYYVVGHSTKRDNEDVGGAFGLGAKAVFAATSSVHLTSYYNGYRHEYLAGIVDGYIRVKPLIEPQPTDEPQGVRISFVFKTSGTQMASFQPLLGEPDSDLPVNPLEQIAVQSRIDTYENGHRFLSNTENAKAEQAYQADLAKLQSWKPKRMGLQVALTTHVKAFLKALLPVGHPGSTYKSIPNIRVNNLPMVIEDWVREYRTDLDMDAHVISTEQYDAIVLKARAAHFSESYIAVGELAMRTMYYEDGTLNRYSCLQLLVSDNFGQKHRRLLLWHNAYYKFKTLAEKEYKSQYEFRAPPTLSTYYKSSGSSYDVNTEPIFEIYCVPPTIRLPVTPERTGIRDTEASHHLINAYDKQAREQLYARLATAWWEFFQKTRDNLFAVVKQATEDEFKDQALNAEVVKARIQYLGVLEGLWSNMFRPAQSYLPAEVREEYKTADISDYVFSRVIREAMDKSGQYTYRIAFANQNSIGAIRFEHEYQISFKPSGELQLLAVSGNRGWPDVRSNRLDWRDWLVSDTEEGLKYVQRKELGDAIAVITRDPKFVDRLRGCVSELGIHVTDGMGASKPKRAKTMATYRVVTMPHNALKADIATYRLERLGSIVDGMYARTVDSSGWLAVGNTGKRISENELLSHIRSYFPHITYSASIAVVRLSDPQKTARLFEEEAGLKPWESVFASHFEELYPEWRRQIASRKLSELSRPLTMMVNMLEAATRSDNPKEWRKFLGWKKDRLDRQLWYRMYVRLLETEAYKSVPAMHNWVEEIYAVDLFKPQTIRRVQRAYGSYRYLEAFERRHGHKLPRPDSYREQSQQDWATIIGDIVGYCKGGKDRVGDPIPKISDRELKFVQEMARAYVENFSQE